MTQKSEDKQTADFHRTLEEAAKLERQERLWNKGHEIAKAMRQLNYLETLLDGYSGGVVECIAHAQDKPAFALVRYVMAETLDDNGEDS